MKELIKQAKEIEEITEKNDLYEIQRYILKITLKFDKITNDIIDIWYGKEYILYNILNLYNIKDEKIYYTTNNEKNKYIQSIINVFGFKSIIDFETQIEITDEIRNRINNLDIIKNYNEYKKMMNIFKKQIRKNEKNCSLNNAIKLFNCILNDYGIKLIGKRKHTRSIDTYIYHININIKYLDVILKNYIIL